MSPSINRRDEAAELEGKLKVQILADRLESELEKVTAVKQIRNEYGDIETHIMYRGFWHHLCRTDLMDDVCTWNPRGEEEAGAKGTLDTVFERARAGKYYGARVGPRGSYVDDVPRFAVIDSWSDG